MNNISLDLRAFFSTLPPSSSSSLLPQSSPPMNLEPPHPPPQSSTASCPLHPDLPVTGFCGSCLRDRLAGLEAASRDRPAPVSSATAALRAIFSRARASGPKSRLPELRRCKSFSGAKDESGADSHSFEPQRKSCDVRARSTLSTLFHKDGEGRAGPSAAWGEIEEVDDEDDSNNVTNDNEEIKEEGEIQVVGEKERGDRSGGDSFVLEAEVAAVGRAFGAGRTEQEIEEEQKTMKDHISLDALSKDQSKRDFKEIAGSFLGAASVFSRKLHKWRRRRKKKREPSAASEAADCGYGRRSCDTYPRFSLDAGRISFDDGRCSFDEPRASWDGYLIGRPPLAPHRMLLVMDSVVEDAPAPPRRSVSQIPLEEPMKTIEEDPAVPVDCLDSRPSLRRQQNPDRPAAGEPDDLDLPESFEIAEYSKPISFCNSVRDDFSEGFERAGGGQWRGWRKSRRWIKVLNIWGFILRRGAGKEDELVACGRGSTVERSLSESWPELRREANGVFRSSSSSSSRETAAHGKMRRNGFESQRRIFSQLQPC